MSEPLRSTIGYEPRRRERRWDPPLAATNIGSWLPPQGMALLSPAVDGLTALPVADARAVTGAALQIVQGVSDAGSGPAEALEWLASWRSGLSAAEGDAADPLIELVTTEQDANAERSRSDPAAPAVMEAMLDVLRAFADWTRDPAAAANWPTE